jgi:hypothetical protein
VVAANKPVLIHADIGAKKNSGGFGVGSFPASARASRPSAAATSLHEGYVGVRRPYVGHGLGGGNDVAVNEISVIALRLRAP